MGWDGIKNYGFGTRPKEVDDEYRRLSRGVPKTLTWTKEKCVGELNELLDILKKILKDDAKLESDNPKKLKKETTRDCITLMNRIFDYIKLLYPTTQTNVNVNVELELDDIVKRWKAKKTPIIIQEIIPLSTDGQTGISGISEE